MTTMQEHARQIAVEAFRGKTDIGGEPYMGHLCRVAKPFNDLPELYAIAILHDLVEDCEEWSFDRLALLFPDRVVDAIKALTKSPGEPYPEFICRISKNELARQVKIIDLKDNMDLSRIDRPLTEYDLKRTKKYHEALLYLTKSE
jgi:(p)ppGpp synthase/HD superfamily hydrolase